MKAPEVGDRVRYRSVGAKPTMYEGRVIKARAHEGCGPDMIHVRTESGALHHVPRARVFFVTSDEPSGDSGELP